LIPGHKVDSYCCIAPLRQTTDATRRVYGHGFTSLPECSRRMPWTRLVLRFHRLRKNSRFCLSEGAGGFSPEPSARNANQPFFRSLFNC
jgi:hypothetical protein